MFADQKITPLHLTIPTYHRDNIMDLSFSPNGRKLLSCGADGHIFEYSSETDGAIVGHQAVDGALIKAVYHPTDGNLYATASSNGQALLWDSRVGSGGPMDGVVSRLWEGETVNSVAFNPANGNELLVAAKCNLGLQDVRFIELRTGEMGFNFNTVLTRLSLKALPASSTKVRNYSPTATTYIPLTLNTASFSESGEKILCLADSFYPVVYHRREQEPQFVLFDAGYKDTVSVKSGTFAGPHEEFVACGGNNASVFLWELQQPGNNHLKSLPDIALPPVSRHFQGYSFDPEAPLVVVDGARERIWNGGISFVNSVIAHPSLPMLCSAGADETIKMHSPFALSHHGSLFNDEDRYIYYYNGNDGSFNTELRRDEMRVSLVLFDYLNTTDILATSVENG